MAKYTGTLAPAASESARLDQIKSLIDTYLSDVFTLNSDTGTGGSRRVRYALPSKYSSHLIDAYHYASYGFQFVVRNIANTTDLSGSNTNGCQYNETMEYLIIKNANSGMIQLCRPATLASKEAIIWSTAGTSGLLIKFSYNAEYIYAHAADTALAASSAIGYTRTTVSGKTIMTPFYPSDDTNTKLLDDPLSDMFYWKNPLALTAYTPFFSDGVEFINLCTGNYCLRINP